MTVRPIDASRFGGILEQWKKDCLEDNDTQGADIISDVILQLDDMPTITQPLITGDTSDGYHTFNELYHHRAVLFSVICNARPDIAWKSKKHHDGTMYDDMFIVGIDTPEGQATYHYDIEPYWGIFHVKELEFAPEWDGHTPDEAIRRISTLAQPNEQVSVEDDEGEKMTKLIDADALYQVEKLLNTNIVRHDEIALNLLEQVLYDIQHFPAVTRPNEPLILDSRLTPKS